MTEIVELGYVTVGVSDLPAWRDFGTNMIGAELSEESSDEVLLRNDVCAYRIRALRDPCNDVLAVGWCVPTEAALEAFITRVEKLGVELRRGSDEEAAERRVRSFVSLTDPNGVVIEVFHGLKVMPERHFHSPLPGSGFLTGREGMGHHGLWAKDIDVSLKFYRDVLGMRCCDRFEGGGYKGAFLRCNDRQHSLAMIERIGVPIPRKLHHIEFEFLDLDDLGRAYDRANEHGVAMTTLGKHSVEQALSFYMYTPFDFGFELSWGGIKVTDVENRPETWHNEAPLWGLKYRPRGTSANI